MLKSSHVGRDGSGERVLSLRSSNGSTRGGVGGSGGEGGALLGEGSVEEEGRRRLLALLLLLKRMEVGLVVVRSEGWSLDGVFCESSRNFRPGVVAFGLLTTS